MKFIKNTLTLTLLLVAQNSFASQKPTERNSSFTNLFARVFQDPNFQNKKKISAKQISSSAEQEQSMKQAVKIDQAKKDLITCLGEKTNKAFDVYLQNIKKMNLTLKNVFISLKSNNGLRDVYNEIIDWAKANKTTNFTELLLKLKDNGFDVREADKQDVNLVWLSIAWHINKMLKVLIDCKILNPNKLESRFCQGEYPLQTAIKHNNTEAIKILIRSGANPNILIHHSHLLIEAVQSQIHYKIDFKAVCKELIYGGLDNINEVMPEIIKKTDNCKKEEKNSLPLFFCKNSELPNFIKIIDQLKADVAREMFYNLDRYLIEDLTSIVLGYTGNQVPIIEIKQQKNFK